MKKPSVATFISIVAVSAPTRILPCARIAGKPKYQKKIAPLKTLIVVNRVLVVIYSIIAAADAKEKTQPILFGHSGCPKKINRQII
jgi:hypothetical protein